MKRRFALPVTIALTIEAVVLLCFNDPVPVSGTPVTSPEKPVPPAWQPADPPPVDLSANTETSGEHRADTSAHPALPEPPPIPVPDRATIAMPPPQDPSSRAPDRIDIAPPGSLPGPADLFGPIGSDQLDNAPVVRVQQPPRYPYEGVRTHRQGEVVVEFNVDEKGRVYGPRVVSSTNSMFEEPTLQAVSQWRFEPGRRNGKAVRFHMMVPVEFHFDQD